MLAWAMHWAHRFGRRRYRHWFRHSFFLYSALSQPEPSRAPHPCRLCLYGRGLAGLCGVMTLAGVTVSLPRLGAAAMVALVIAGQVAFSLVIDRFGLFGVPPHPITVQRAIAAVLLLAGTVLLLQE